MNKRAEEFAERACLLPDRTGRLHALPARAKERPLRIAAFGGSVTYGYTTDANICAYPALLCRQLPFEAKLRNFAAAGTNAWLGLYLAARDLAGFAPDLVIVEYAVNQEANAELTAAYESLLWQLLTLPSAPAVIAVMCTNANHITSAHVLTQAAAHYGLPVISVQAGLGSIPWAEYACDAVHPHAGGQEMLAAAVLTACMHAEEHPEYALPEMPCLNRDAAALRVCNLDDGTGGLREKIAFLDLFDSAEAVILQRGADTYTIEAEGAAFLVIFRQSSYADTVNAAVTLDGDAPVTLCASCMNGWGNPFVQRIIPKTQKARHTLRFQAEPGSGRFVLWGIAAIP